MKIIQRILAPLALLCTTGVIPLVPTAGGKDISQPPASGKQPVVQLALLLDTSNSMDGLIEQAKGQLWKIVNEFITAKQNGLRPEVQVALFEYGNNRLAKGQGYIRLVQPLTNDLDKISEELFALRTNGGEEYCGWVIQDAVKRLGWDRSADAFKAIFIAGNEPFTQGPVPYTTSCKSAIEQGIVVNTIHCGGRAEGLATKWEDGALLAEGKYMVIDQNRAVVHLKAPQDEAIANLGVELNKTYVAFGTAGQANSRRQAAEDANSSRYSAQGSAVQRSLFKSSAQYRNDSWDLVDASRNGRVKLSELKKEELPVELQPMTPGQQQSFLDAKATQREKIQKDITRLNAQRALYLAEQSKKTGATNTLDTVVISAIREQAVKKNYRFE